MRDWRREEELEDAEEAAKGSRWTGIHPGRFFFEHFQSGQAAEFPL